MKITSKKIAPWAMAALCLSLTSSYSLADDNTATGQAPNNQTSQGAPAAAQTGQAVDQNNNLNGSQPGQVSQIGKASQYNGNNQNPNDQYNPNASANTSPSTQSGQATGQPSQYNQSGQYNENQANQTANETNNEEGRPDRFDRASGIVGMNVRNQNDEHLGKIKDVVFDLRSERIAYVVLAASGTGVMGFNEKLHAVPINAFTPSADGRYLILRADKSKLEAAAGFDRKNWPSASNPSWGAQPFWENNGSQNSDYNRNTTGTPNDQPVKP